MGVLPNSIVLWDFEKQVGHLFKKHRYFVGFWNMELSGFWAGPIFKQMEVGVCELNREIVSFRFVSCVCTRSLYDIV